MGAVRVPTLPRSNVPTLKLGLQDLVLQFDGKDLAQHRLRMVYQWLYTLGPPALMLLVG